MDQKTRTPKQLANDKRLGDLARTRKLARDAEALIIGKKPVANQLPGEDYTKTPEQVDLPTLGEQADEAQKNLSPTDLLLMRLMNEIDELKRNQRVMPSPEAALDVTAQMVNPTLGKNGLQGQIFKWSIDTDHYPSPLERLYDEPTLRRFNLRENYFFDWQVEGVEYEKHNISYAEPKFVIRIFRKIFGDDGVTESGQMALINTNILHEDELVARIVADKMGLREQFPDFRELMDEVRYLRIRRWLLDLFTPPKVERFSRKPRDMVIEGKVVAVFDTEALIDGEVGKSKAAAVARETRI